MSEDQLGIQETNKAQNKLEFAGFRILQRINDEKLWILDNTNWIFEGDKRIKNSNRILEIAKEEVAQTNTEKEVSFKYNLPPIEEVEKTAQHAVNRFASFTVISGLLPAEAVVLASKFTKGSDVKVTEDWGNIGLNLDINRLDSSQFPKTKDEKPEVILSPGIIRHKADACLEFAQKLGIQLTPEQAVNAAIYSIAAHEWAHSLERALQTKYLNQAHNLPEYDKKKDYWTILGKSLSVVHDEIEKISLPQLPTIDRTSQKSAHSERFATSFELMALTYGLKEAGVSQVDAEKITKENENLRLRKLDNFRRLREGIQMNDLDLGLFTLDVDMFLRENGVTDWIIDFPKGLGYLGSYNTEQIKKSIETVLLKITSPDKIKEDLIEARNNTNIAQENEET